MVGDLLKVLHFGSGNRTQYMYHVAVIEETDWIFRNGCKDAIQKIKPHYRLYVLCDNEQRVYKTAKIVNMHDWETKESGLKLIKVRELLKLIK